MLARIFGGLALAAGVMLSATSLAHANQSWDPGNRFDMGAPSGHSNFNLFGGSGPVARSVVMLTGNHAPGTIIVNTSERRLYFVVREQGLSG